MASIANYDDVVDQHFDEVFVVVVVVAVGW